MCELSRLLTTLKVDGRTLTCERAVLISQGDAEAPTDWGLSIFGARAFDLARTGAAHSFSASDGAGRRYSGWVYTDPGSSPWHVHLRGSGALHQLRDVGFDEVVEHRRSGDSHARR